MSQENLTTENILQDLPEPLLNWYRASARDLPWRRTRDPYRIWVSEIMLQQTRVAAVLGYYARFLTAFPTVEALAAAPEERLMKLWEGLGYYSRARNLQKTARIVRRAAAGSRRRIRSCWPCRGSGTTPPAPSPPPPLESGRQRWTAMCCGW